jgi:hypothetical protein
MELRQSGCAKFRELMQHQMFAARGRGEVCPLLLELAGNCVATIATDVTEKPGLSIQSAGLAGFLSTRSSRQK